MARSSNVVECAPPEGCKIGGKDIENYSKGALGIIARSSNVVECAPPEGCKNARKSF